MSFDTLYRGSVREIALWNWRLLAQMVRMMMYCYPSG
jgi:hypothetical protein